MAAGSLLGGALYYGSRLRDTNAQLLGEALDQAPGGRGPPETAQEQAQSSAPGRRHSRAEPGREGIPGTDLRRPGQIEVITGHAGAAQSLLNTAIAGLAEIARSTAEAAPDLDRAVAHQRLAEVYSRVGRDIEAGQQLEPSLELAKGIAARRPRDLDVLECLGVDYR